MRIGGLGRGRPSKFLEQRCPWLSSQEESPSRHPLAPSSGCSEENLGKLEHGRERQIERFPANVGVFG